MLDRICFIGINLNDFAAGNHLEDDSCHTKHDIYKKNYGLNDDWSI